MPKSPASYVRAFVILSLLGIWAITQSHPAMEAEGLITGLALLAAGLTCLWTHEIGHMLGALATRLRVAEIYLWPYLFRHDDDKWTFKKSSSGMFLADGGFFPAQLSGARKKLIVSLLSGFAATLLVGIVAFAFAQNDPQRLGRFTQIHDATASGWAIFGHRYLSCLWLFCAALLIVSAWPSDKNPYWDGPFLLALFRGGAYADQLIARYALNGIVTRRRPREWPEEWLIAGEGNSGPSETMNHQFRYYERCLDLDRIDEAKKHLDETIRIADAHPAINAHVFHLERVFLYAWLNLEEFDWDDVYRKHEKPSHSWISTFRAKCMLCLRDGKPDEAVALAVRGRDGIRENFNYGVWQMYADWFDRIIERAFAVHAANQEGLPSSSRAESR